MAKIDISKLKRIGLLGCGGFGVVEMFHEPERKKSYAIKALDKGYIEENQMVPDVMTEKEMFRLSDGSPFIIKCYGTYHTSTTANFIMELALGGEVYATYEKKDLYGSVNHARYYTAGCICAFSHLHSRNVIYRDLKPENLMLSEAGHLKLTDMGLAKKVIGSTYTICGTPEYFAPEVIEGEGHNRGVDWWCLGILIYELMSGGPPFEGNSHADTNVKIKQGFEYVKLKQPLADKKNVEAVNLIKALLRPESSERLPMLKKGEEQLKNHKWYSGFNWKDFESLKMMPPYVPQCGNATDLRNFSVSPEDMPPRITYKDKNTKRDEEAYKGFGTDNVIPPARR